MRRILAVAVLLLCGYLVARHQRAAVPTAVAPGITRARPTPNATTPWIDSPVPRVARSARAPSGIEQAIETHARNVRVDASGTVSRVLPDDNEGERHQRFIVRLPSGETVLIAHNIDIAPRVDGVRRGMPIEFEGEYVWNAQGGVVHWTHHDPSGHHQTGFLKYNGRLYQ